MLDGNDQTFWAVSHRQGQSHQGVFEFDKPVDLAGEEGLIVQLHFQNQQHKQHAIGRCGLELVTRWLQPGSR